MKLTLETPRLILRPWNKDDVLDMYEGWAKDPEVTKFLTWPPHESPKVTEKIIKNWIKEYKKKERLNFAIVLKDDNALIGGIDVVGYIGGVKGTPVIGYASNKKYWGNGYMTEACKKVLEHLFSLGYPEVRIDANVDNIASNRVIQKCGGEWVRKETQYLPYKKTEVEVNCYMVKRP